MNKEEPEEEDEQQQEEEQTETKFGDLFVQFTVVPTTEPIPDERVMKQLFPILNTTDDEQSFVLLQPLDTDDYCKMDVFEDDEYMDDEEDEEEEDEMDNEEGDDRENNNGEDDEDDQEDDDDDDDTDEFLSEDESTIEDDDLCADKYLGGILKGMLDV